MLSHVDRVVERLCGRLETIAAGDGPVDLRVHHMLVERVTVRLSAVQHYTQSLDDLLCGAVRRCSSGVSAISHVKPVTSSAC